MVVVTLQLKSHAPNKLKMTTVILSTQKKLSEAEACYQENLQPRTCASSSVKETHREITTGILVLNSIALSSFKQNRGRPLRAVKRRGLTSEIYLHPRHDGAWPAQAGRGHWAKGWPSRSPPGGSDRPPWT